MTLKNGLLYMKDIVASTIKIGSPNRRLGITMHDLDTGDPYCVAVQDGVTKTTMGECLVVYAENTAGGVKYEKKDEVAPVITLLGNNPAYIPVGGEYSDPGAEALDDEDELIAIRVNGLPIDTTATSTHEVTYDAQDSAGNEAQTVVRVIHVGMEAPTEEAEPSLVVETQEEAATTTEETVASTTESIIEEEVLVGDTATSTPLVSGTEDGDGETEVVTAQEEIATSTAGVVIEEEVSTTTPIAIVEE